MTTLPEATTSMPVSNNLLPINLPSMQLDGLHAEPTPRFTLGAFTTLVGPNGSGKTQTLRQIKNLLQNQIGQKKARLLASGRSSPIERFRASIEGPEARQLDRASVGQTYMAEQWWQIESITGDYLALDKRADLRLKIEARIQQFFSRTIQLTWSQQGLQIMIVPSDGKPPYPANHEASGILQLIPMLASIYNDEIGALLIDEPEISLHPQYQAFLLSELVAAAGDPSMGKKIIVIATHSPSMLHLTSIADLPNIIFFTNRNSAPRQITDQSYLRSSKLSALIARLSATHKLAFFADSTLLVEGASDEIIVSQLAAALDLPLLATNTQIVPVTGKGELPEVTKLFSAMGKRVTVLADLDALTDSNTLVNHFSVAYPGAAQDFSHASLVAMDSGIRSNFTGIVNSKWTALEPIASIHAYWAKTPSTDRTEETKRRATLATMFSHNADALFSIAPELRDIRTRLLPLFNCLEKVGCFVLRKGTIEDYFLEQLNPGSKPEAAAMEAMAFTRNTDKLNENYSDVIRSILFASTFNKIDENLLLRERLGSLLGGLFQSITAGMSNGELQAKATAIGRSDAEIFRLTNQSTATSKKIAVDMASPLFQREKFPAVFEEEDNLTKSIAKLLP